MPVIGLVVKVRFSGNSVDCFGSMEPGKVGEDTVFSVVLYVVETVTSVSAKVCSEKAVSLSVVTVSRTDTVNVLKDEVGSARLSVVVPVL